MSNQSLVIRPAKIQDCKTILSLIMALAEYEKLAHEVIATEEKLATTLFGAKPQAEVWIGEWDGKPICYSLFFPSYSTFLAKPGIYLEDLFVLPEYRGRGIGLAMLKQLARLGVERGCGRLEWSVLDWNTPAINFYKKLGAVAQDEWTVYRLTGNALAQMAKD